MNIEFLDVAETELDDAFEYYDDIYKGLGNRFVEELELTLTRIKANPMAWQQLGVIHIGVCFIVFHIRLFTRYEVILF
jgi:hypothetical protein